MLKTIRSISSFLADLGASAAALIMVAMTLHILLEIVLRSLFNQSTHVLDEFVGYGIAAMTFLSMAQAISKGVMIRVNLVIGKVQSGKRILELFATATTLVVATGIAWLVGRNIVRNIKRDAVSETVAQVPLWIPEAVVLFGLILLIMTLIVRAIDVLVDFERIAIGGNH